MFGDYLPGGREIKTMLLTTMLPCETMFECQVCTRTAAFCFSTKVVKNFYCCPVNQERKYVESHQGAMHKPLPTALMNKAFKHFQQDQSENTYGYVV